MGQEESMGRDGNAVEQSRPGFNFSSSSALGVQLALCKRNWNVS